MIPPSDPADRTLDCPGCGGRNLAGANECDWCGRAFLSPGHRLRLTAWQVASSVLLLALLISIVALAILNLGRNVPPPRPASTPAAAAASTTPTAAVTARVTQAPTSTPTPIPTPSPTPPPATPTPAQSLAKVGNTNGLGLKVHSEPGSTAVVGGLRDNQQVIVIGAPQTAAGRQWVEIESADHTVHGWVSSDLLQPQT